MSLTDSDADKIFPTDLTVQPPHLCAESLNVTGIVNTEGESDEPLLRMTINRFTKLKSTSIGACHSHMLCASPLDLPSPIYCIHETASVDGAGFLMFLNHLSQLYQGLGPVDPPPYYEPKAIRFVEPLRAPLPMYRRYDLSAPPPWEQPERRAMEFVAIRLTATQLTEIRNFVRKGMRQPGITRMDVVVALFARCLSEVEPEFKPIDAISYVVNVRVFIASPVTRLISSQHRGMGIYPTNALNAVIWLSMRLQVPKGVDPSESVVAYAAEIRKSMDKLGDPGLIKDMAADVAKIQSQVAWDRTGQDIASTNQGSLVANILWR